MAEANEVPTVHVGDVGTLYHAKIQDAGAPFDPTLATTKELIFLPPRGAAIVKPADVTTEDGEWFLDYRAVAGFHAVAGRWKVQGRVVFGDGQTYRTVKVPFQVAPNLN